MNKLHPRHGKNLEPRFALQINGGMLTKASLLQFIRAFLQGNQMEQGYYLEFGVFNGQSIIETYGILRGTISRIFGFDSFEGLPALSEIDQAGLELTPSFSKGNFKSLPIQTVKDLITASCTNLPPDSLVLTKGFYEQSLAKFDKKIFEGKGDCLVIHIDCDLYSSSKDVFDFIESVVVDGTWILLDDYWFYRGSPKHGQRRAFDEFLRNSKFVGATEYATYNGYSKAFIAYRK